MGGTMLYFRSLLSGISRMPEANQELRNEISDQAKKYGWGFLHKELLEVDFIVQKLQEVIDKLQVINSNLKVIFTKDYYI